MTTSIDAETCRACGLLIASKPYVAWNAARGREVVDLKCRTAIHAAGDDGYNGLYPTRYRESEVHETIRAMRAAEERWQTIATRLNMWPRTVRDIGVNVLGLSVNLPGRPPNNGGWAR